MNNNIYKKSGKAETNPSRTQYTKKDKNSKLIEKLISEKAAVNQKPETPYKKRQTKPIIELTVDEDGFLRDFLQKKLTGKSLNKIKSILYHNQVMVNGIITSKYDYPVRTGQTVAIKSHGAKNTPGSEFLDIIYEDNEIIVINKPAGLLIIGTDKEKDKTAYHYLTEYLRERDDLEHIFIVHRLDKATSGIVMFSKNEELKQLFQEKWNELVILREYTAIVQGNPKNKKGKITSWLKETETHIVYSCGARVPSVTFTKDKSTACFTFACSEAERNEGKLATTNYEVLKENDEYSLLRVTLETGRKNQIRVHMKDIETPIIGDKKYGGKSTPLKRLGLHANKLIIKHPVTGKKLSFEAKADKLFSKFVK